MAQIPKGRLVMGPFKPICRDCAIYFSRTVHELRVRKDPALSPALDDHSRPQWLTSDSRFLAVGKLRADAKKGSRVLASHWKKGVSLGFDS